jgi:hypothetical protein
LERVSNGLPINSNPATALPLQFSRSIKQPKNKIVKGIVHEN